MITYKNDYFDFLVSWNVIHYCDSIGSMKRNIKEYSRVLEKDGFLVLSTAGLKDKHYVNSKKISENIYKILYKGDIRHNEKMFCFENKNNLKKYFQPYFKKFIIGRYKVDFMGFDWLVLVCQKK